jgi:hypothetical protein
MGEALKRLRTVSAQQSAEAAIKGGFPVTCATCDHLRKAFDTDADDCGKTITCGGPIFNRCYPDYAGPLKPETYDKICLKCGSDHVDFYVFGGIKRFGLCTSHKGIFDKINTPGTTPPLVMRVPGRSV